MQGAATYRRHCGGGGGSSGCCGRCRRRVKQTDIVRRQFITVQHAGGQQNGCSEHKQWDEFEALRHHVRQ